MKENISVFLKEEKKGWKTIDLVWLLITTVTILSLSLYWHDNIIGILAALTGVWCVILT